MIYEKTVMNMSEKESKNILKKVAVKIPQVLPVITVKRSFEEITYLTNNLYLLICFCIVIHLRKAKNI
jgi:hypothetical protein